MNRIFKSMLVAVAAICIMGCQQYDDFNKDVSLKNLEGIYYVQEGSYILDGYYEPIYPEDEHIEVNILEGKLIVNDYSHYGTSEFVIPFEELKQVSPSLTHFTEPLEYEYRTEKYGYDFVIRFYYNNSDKAHKKIYCRWEDDGYISEFYGMTNALPFEPKPAFLCEQEIGSAWVNISKITEAANTLFSQLHDSGVIESNVFTPRTLAFRANQIIPEGGSFIYLNHILMDNDSNIECWITLSKDASTIYVNTNGTEFVAPRDCAFMFAAYLKASPETYLFNNECLQGIWNIDFGNCFNTTQTQNMQLMFAAGNYSSLDLSCFNTSNVTNMNAMFDGCEYLKSVNLSSFDTKKTYVYVGMFSGCTTLEELDLSNFYIWSCKKAGMFYRCHNLKKLILGKNCLFADNLIYDEQAHTLIGGSFDFDFDDSSYLFYEMGANVSKCNIYYKRPVIKTILQNQFTELTAPKFNWIAY